MSNSPPLDEAPAETAHRNGFPWYWILFGLLIAYAGFGLYYDHSDPASGVLEYGVILSPPILLALWAAFVQQRFYNRFLWSLLCCTYLSFLNDLSVTVHCGGPGGNFMFANLALFFVASVILVLVRRFSRWHITQHYAKDAPSAYHAHQFGINQFLVLTAIIALACGLMRTLFIITRCHFSITAVADYFSSLLIVGFSSSIVPWITMAHRRKRYGLMLLTMLIAVASGCIGEYARIQVFGFAWYMDFGFFVRSVVSSLWMQLGAILSLVISTLVLRFAGFRMIRDPKMRA